MFGRNRLHYLALGGYLAVLLLGSHALGQEENQPAKEQLQPESAEQPAIERPSTSPPVATAEPSRNDTNGENHREERDKPQEPSLFAGIWNSIAFWADANIGGKDGWAQWIMAFFGAVATGISIWAVVLLRRTLAATKDTVNEARRANKAAQLSAQAAQETVYSDRAWISFVSHEHNVIFDDSDKDHIKQWLVFWLRWKNTGRSPAIDVEIWTKATIVDKNDSIPVFDRNPGSNFEVRRTTLGPDISAGGTKVFLDEEKITPIRSGDKKFIMYGLVIYKDIYKKNVTRHTEVCGQFVIDYDPAVAWSKAAPMIGFTPIGDQNTAD